MAQEEIFWIEQVKSGKVEYADKIFNRYEAAIHKHINKAVIPGYSREDLVQEIKLAIVHGCHNYDPAVGVKPITYFYQIMNFHIANLTKHLNRNKRKIVFQVPVSYEAEKSSELLTNIRDGDSEKELDEVDTVHSIGGLNLTELEVFLMLAGGMKTTDVAKVLEVTNARALQIKQRLSRKLKQENTHLNRAS